MVLCKYLTCVSSNNADSLPSVHVKVGHIICCLRRRVSAKGALVPIIYVGGVCRSNVYILSWVNRGDTLCEMYDYLWVSGVRESGKEDATMIP
jgi:hypothetical protein